MHRMKRNGMPAPVLPGQKKRYILRYPTAPPARAAGAIPNRRKRMEIRNVVVVSPGDMGQAIAKRIKESGMNVHTALDGRSERTKKLAQEAGLSDCGSIEKLVATCDLIVSVIDPGQSPVVAGQVAAAMKKTGRKIAFADMNAVSPQTARDA